MGGKLPSGGSPPRSAPLTPRSTHPAPFWRNGRAWLEKAREHSDYFYVVGVVIIFLLAVYILISDQ